MGVPYFYQIPPSQMIPKKFEACDFDQLSKGLDLIKYADGSYDINRSGPTLADFQRLSKEVEKLQLENEELKKPKPPIREQKKSTSNKIWLVHFLIITVSIGLIAYELFLVYMKTHTEK